MNNNDKLVAKKLERLMKEQTKLPEPVMESVAKSFESTDSLYGREGDVSIVPDLPPSHYEHNNQNDNETVNDININNNNNNNTNNNDNDNDNDNVRASVESNYSRLSTQYTDFSNLDKNKAPLAFKKFAIQTPTTNENTASGLSAQIKKSQSPKSNDDKVKSRISFDDNGAMTLKNDSYDKNRDKQFIVYVEILRGQTQKVIIYVNPTIHVSQFINTISQKLVVLQNKNCNNFQLCIADEDGDIDDDYPPLQPTQLIGSFGLNTFFLKYDADDKIRETISQDISRLKSDSYAISSNTTTPKSTDSPNTQQPIRTCGCNIL